MEDDLFNNASRQTSNAAFNSFKPHRETVRLRILWLISERGTVTDDEVEQALDIRHQTASSVRRSMVKDGTVEATGDKRPTRSGRQAQTWRLTV